MTQQLALLQDANIKKSIINAPIDALKLSKYNPRYTRNDESINRLAQRISRNGFEITRALWATKNGTGYEVFAGGTRLEAARRAGCKTLPIVLFEGLTEDDTVRLADEDNENDEYHDPIGDVDKWEHCAWLKENGWDVPRIAKAKDKDDKHIYRWLKLHTLSEGIKNYSRRGLLKEAHLSEIIYLLVDENLSLWLDTEQAQLELTEKAINGKSKNGEKTAKAVRNDVNTWKAFIAEAERLYQEFGKDITLYDFDDTPPSPYLYDAQRVFVKELADTKARSLNAVKAAGRTVTLHIKQNLESYETYIRQESQAASQKAVQAELEAKLLSKFINADCLDVLNDWQFGPINLLLTDPPYGKDYQSNRRWATKAPDKIQGDNEAESISLLKDMLKKAYSHLADNAHILIFCDWKFEPEFREVIIKAGLTIKGSLIWVKEEHSAGDVKGSFGPSHERIIHAVKGSPEVTPRIRDVIECPRSRETTHPAEKPVDLLLKLINSTTYENDLIVDTFAGCGSTLIAGMKSNRDCIGIEIDQSYHEEGCGRLLKGLEDG